MLQPLPQARLFPLGQSGEQVTFLHPPLDKTGLRKAIVRSAGNLWQKGRIRLAAFHQFQPFAPVAGAKNR
jgi:hypothetical protein